MSIFGQDRARDCFGRALAIAETAYGSDHPEVARAANNLGSVLYSIGDLEGVRDCFRRTLTNVEASLPSEHSHVRLARQNLGAVLLELEGSD
jgi:hypothetical protein